MNTAARMESNGEINKIQVAESTAIALQQSGKGYVLCKKVTWVWVQNHLILYITFPFEFTTKILPVITDIG